MDDAELIGDNNKNVFQTLWNVVEYNGGFTLQDPTDYGDTDKNRHVAVTYSQAEPFIAEEGEYWDSLQNPLMKLSIFATS